MGLREFASSEALHSNVGHEEAKTIFIEHFPDSSLPRQHYLERIKN
jgi:hypothetical protein